MMILPHRRKAFRGGAVPELPYTTGLLLQLDASDSTTLFDATSGGSLPADAGNVKRIEDLSGNARHFTEASVAPTRNAANQNGLDTIDFNGSSQYITYTGGANWITGNTLTAFLVQKQNTHSALSRVISCGTDTASNHDYNNAAYIVLFLNGDSLGEYYSYYNSSGINGYTGTNNFSALTFTRNAGTIQGFSNGIISVNHSGAGTTNFGIKRVRIGANCGTSDERSSLSLCEFLIYDSALGTSDREAVESYLMTKWGI